MLSAYTFLYNRVKVSKHADLVCECITCYIYAHRLWLCEARCFKDSDTCFLYVPPPLQNQPSVAVCNSVSLHADCGWTVNRVLRTTKLLTKVAICINITRYTQLNLYSMFCLQYHFIKRGTNAFFSSKKFK